MTHASERQHSPSILRAGSLVLLALAGLAVCLANAALGQYQHRIGQENRGLFGQRILGQPLRPTPDSFGGGILHGYAGELVGRWRPQGTMFPLAAPMHDMRSFSRVLRSNVVQTQQSLGLLPQIPLEALPVGAISPEMRAAAGLPGSENPGTFPTPPAQTPGATIPDIAPQAPAGRVEASQPPPPPISGGPVAQPSQSLLEPSAQPSPSDASPITSGGPATHLEDLIRRSGHIRGEIRVAMQASTAILEGRVASDNDRRRAEMLARLEPGVNRVLNRLMVDPAIQISSVPGPSRR